MNTAPDVHAFLDYRAFLKAWFDARKAANPRFSHRVFARLAGHRSPSQLSLVIQGKRNLTPTSTEAYCRALALDAEEAAFFARLVQLAQATTDEERNSAWRAISASRRLRDAGVIEGRGFEALSHWYYAATRELAHRADFREDPAWIARELRPRVTVAQARQAVATLLELGLLERRDGRVVPGDASLTTPREVSGLAVHNYHRGMLALASDSIDAHDASQRHLCAVTACIPEALIPTLKDELNRMQERLLDLCDTALDESGGDRVVQLHLSLFPLSGTR